MHKSSRSSCRSRRVALERGCVRRANPDHMTRVVSPAILFIVLMLFCCVLLERVCHITV